MKTKPTLLNLAIATLITGTTLSLSGCGGGGGDAAAGYTPDVPDQYVSGTVTRGPVAGATVTIFAVNADGTDGAPIGSTITNNNGEFRLKLMLPVNQMIVARVSNGTYSSETTAATLQVLSSISAMTKASTTQPNISLNLSAVSDMAYVRAKQLTSQGTPLELAKTIADNAMKKAYGLSSSPEAIAPSFAAANLNSEQGRLAMVLSGLDKLANQQSTCTTAGTIDSLYAALSNDIADGVFDGKNLTNNITLCGSAMDADTGTTQYHNAIAGVSPSLFGLSVANADFTSAQNASIGQDTTSTSANNLVINNANAESVATAVFALLNLQAGQVPGFSLNNQQAIGANTYLLSGTCTTNGSISETIYDNNGSQALDIGDRFNLSLSNCNYLQDALTPSSGLIKTGSQDAFIVSNTNASGTMSMNEQWGTNKSRSYQMTGLLPFLVQGQTPPTYSTTAISSLSLSQDGYNLASGGLSVAYSSATGLFMNGDIVSTNSPNNGRFSITTTTPLSGLDFNCFSAGTVVIGGATTNMRINFSHSGSYTLGLDTNKDGIVDETLIGTQTCPVSLSLLK